MKLRLALACALIASRPASACTCVSPIDGNSAREAAKRRAFDAAAIFEGEPERIELRWSLLQAKDGDLVPAGLAVWDPSGRDEPVVVVTFRVLRAYKGDLHSEVEIVTGLGGGDCGRVFSPGLTYLVYAYSGQSPSPSELTVALCEPGGWIGDADQAASLRYLRKEPPTRDDLSQWIGLPQKQLAARRQLADEQSSKQFESITGRVCGRMDPLSLKDWDVSFVSTKAISVSQHPWAQVKQDGSFCSPRSHPENIICISPNRPTVRHRITLE
jgi:hypothetical protein